jgi:rRNA pseudouridine-1189 N-methylase Emg1 (Nep1/Mra1 family)
MRPSHCFDFKGLMAPFLNKVDITQNDPLISFVMNK